VPPLEINNVDHEGGAGYSLQVKGGKWAKATDWFRAHRPAEEDAGPANDKTAACRPSFTC
jgi:hypothetical protein